MGRPVEKPRFKTGTCVYDGTTLWNEDFVPAGSDYWYNWDDSAFTYSPNILDIGVDAGNYGIIFSLVDDNWWSDGSSGDFNAVYIVSPMPLDPPVWTGTSTYNYNGQLQGPPNYTAPSDQYCVITGDGTSAQRGPGSYDISVELMEPQNFTWTDGPTGIELPTRTLTWTIIESDKYVRIWSNGAWHRAIPYVYISSNGQSARWHKAEAYVYNNNTWKPTRS